MYIYISFLTSDIPHHPKHGFWHQNRVFSMFRSWITPQVKLSLLEVILDPLQPLHPILDCQVDLRHLKMVLNDSPSPKTWGLTPEPWPWHIQKLSYSPSYSFTSWSPPWPPTVQSLHPVLHLQVNLRLTKMVPNDSPYPKTWGWTSK